MYGRRTNPERVTATLPSWTGAPKPVMEPAELEEVGELVFAAVNPMTDVVYVDEATFTTVGETTALVARMDRPAH